MEFLTSRRTSQWRTVLAASLVLTVAACASTPPAPTASLQAAQQSIVSAERIDAGHHAPGELGEARSKLAAANAAVSDERMAHAERLALESRASAELASARTAAAKALEENTAIRTGNAAMLEELNRNRGVSQ